MGVLGLLGVVGVVPAALPPPAPAGLPPAGGAATVAPDTAVRGFGMVSAVSTPEISEEGRVRRRGERVEVQRGERVVG